ncbi:hypothetical protein PRIC2_012031 [Phytophthora ramorum]
MSKHEKGRRAGQSGLTVAARTGSRDVGAQQSTARGARAEAESLVNAGSAKGAGTATTYKTRGARALPGVRIKTGASPRTGGTATREGGDLKRDHGDGREVFAQIRAYLVNDAKAEYVALLVARLALLATERRYAAYQAGLQDTDQASGSELRSTWRDEVPVALKEQYEGLTSFWDLGDAVHVGRLERLM